MKCFVGPATPDFMRNNQPVSNREYTFPADQTLISVTDLKGRITYCNHNFESVSGFNQEELLGQPHNLVRHPDMPEEAFRDMWQTLQDGHPWSALVKNRRKNGDHYWVRANASPVRDGGRILGYMSVRTAVTREEVAAAESLYARMRAEAQSGRVVLGLERGQVVRRSTLASLTRRLTPDVNGWIVFLVVLTALAPMVAGLLDLPGWINLLAGVLPAALAIAFLWHRQFKPVADLQHWLNLVAAGDLSNIRELRYSGRFGEMELALNQLILGVRTVVRDARHEVGNLRSGSSEISAGSRELSARAETQASNLEQTAAALEEITGTVRNTAEMAKEGSQLAREASSVSRASLEAVQSARDTMKEIEASSHKIAEILKLIESVAFQTNILALNAAVEAARAGDQGRGFAVVASEVRALAQRTTAAARDVRSLIDESNEGVRKGNLTTEQALTRMRESIGAVGKTADILSQIENASHEQDVGISQINQAVAQLDTITQQNASMSEELSAVSTVQDQLVLDVHNTIRVFKLTPRDKTLAEEDAVALRREMLAKLGQAAEDAGPPRLTH